MVSWTFCPKVIAVFMLAYRLFKTNIAFLLLVRCLGYYGDKSFNYIIEM